jgi:flagellar biogenesis protein FliO
MGEEDVSKMVFICLGFIGLFEWVVMTFCLENDGVTYQRAMNLICSRVVGKQCGSLH